MSQLTAEQVQVRERWVQALRSGEYQQGKWQLRDNEDHYCCLGVLCEVVGAPWERFGDHSYRVGGFASYPPDEVLAKGGIRRYLWGDLEGHLLASDLGDLNDNANLTFEEIADVIELDTLMRQDGAL